MLLRTKEGERERESNRHQWYCLKQCPGRRASSLCRCKLQEPPAPHPNPSNRIALQKCRCHRTAAPLSLTEDTPISRKPKRQAPTGKPRRLAGCTCTVLSTATGHWASSPGGGHRQQRPGNPQPHQETKLRPLPRPPACPFPRNRSPPTRTETIQGVFRYQIFLNFPNFPSHRNHIETLNIAMTHA